MVLGFIQERITTHDKTIVRTTQLMTCRKNFICICKHLNLLKVVVVALTTICLMDIFNVELIGVSLTY